MSPKINLSQCFSKYCDEHSEDLIDHIINSGKSFHEYITEVTDEIIFYTSGDNRWNVVSQAFKILQSRFNKKE